MHTFHIPVMGIGFTIDTPLKVSHLGIDSVISLVDDMLLEKMRKTYCRKHNRMYAEISDKIDDFRAKRITSYLNLINDLIDEKFEEIKKISFEKMDVLKAYFNLLPKDSSLKKEFMSMMSIPIATSEVRKWAEKHLVKGSLDVNIMTKIDKDNYIENKPLPAIYNDAHAALRGFANSNISSSLILSAGMNPRLYGYIEEFEDFYPVHGLLKKKIVLKVSDYRSAFIQGKFLAKKGIWVSEFRIESGLNCGGHAFATNGFLLGPILESFKNNKKVLISALHEVYIKALIDKNKEVPKTPLPIKISAQGGVGTSEEHDFLLQHYEVDSVGWGSPFLVVPEVTNVDQTTINRLLDAKEDDLYLSHISPLGIPFNNLRGNSKDLEKKILIAKGRPGSSCPKKYIAINKEFTDQSICTASRQYQHLKIKELDSKPLNDEEYNAKYTKIVEKSCICVGLGTSALLIHDLDTKTEGKGVAICPGPNMAYFSKKMSLIEVTDHIYGRSNMISRIDRPNMFIKELNLYLDYLKNKIEEAQSETVKNQEKYLKAFAANLQEGINYYLDLFRNLKVSAQESKMNIISQFQLAVVNLQSLEIEIRNLSELEK